MHSCPGASQSDRTGLQGYTGTSLLRADTQPVIETDGTHVLRLSSRTHTQMHRWAKEAHTQLKVDALGGRFRPSEFLIPLTQGQQQSKFQLMWEMLLVEPG